MNYKAATSIELETRPLEITDSQVYSTYSRYC